jgi:leucyl aminopeptidase
MFLSQRPANAIALVPIAREDFDAWRQGADTATATWVDLNGFKGQANQVCVLPDASGAPSRALVGMNRNEWLYSLAAVPGALQAGSCFVDAELEPAAARLATLGFALATYRFTRYGKTALKHIALTIPDDVNQTEVEADFRAIALVRDLINTAPEDMMPQHLQAAVQSVADHHGADLNTIIGDDLLAQNYPAIHAVGRASVHAPRLINLTWGDVDAPKLTLVGKGVCFDSGGLDIKPASGMRHMKKDMGGAAHALALAQRVMAAGLNVRLRLLIPAVENAISGNAFHPGDVLATRGGKTIEVDNTDAEGRLILCDALTEASAESPAQILDFATLTGAARVALGTELPAMFCNDDAVADALRSASQAVADPVWRMPLHQPYRQNLDSSIADMVNTPSVPFGGAITAALFLEAFIENDTSWAHFDIMAWNRASRPGRPEGGEAMGLRACFEQLDQRFGRG